MPTYADWQSTTTDASTPRRRMKWEDPVKSCYGRDEAGERRAHVCKVRGLYIARYFNGFGKKDVLVSGHPTRDSAIDHLEFLLWAAHSEA